MREFRLVPLALCGALAACGSSSSKSASGPLTYYKDVKPIVEQRCVECHQPNAIAPFTLQSYGDLMAHTAAIRTDVANHIMPPWPPSDGCSDYLGDRSITDAEVATITNWVDQGAKEGDPSQYEALPAAATTTLSRVDNTLKMPVAYKPKITPDDYRCFVLDWPYQTVKYVTGFRAVPGQPSIVHHTIAYLAQPSDVAAYQKLDAADPDPGYTCFGGPGVDNSFTMIGAWAPGGGGNDFPAGTGIKVQPGSKIILQVHYNTLTTAPIADQTAIELKVDDSVTKEAAILPWLDLQWLTNSQSMLIPAGSADTMHDYSFDPSMFLSYITNGVLGTGQPFTIYSAALHMHLHGTHAETDLVHADGTKECMLDIPRWDFHWQGSYGFSQPKVFHPGDQLSIECHWNNTAANQPIVNGQPLPPKDLTWGEGTTDEMCIAFFYVTK